MALCIFEARRTLLIAREFGAVLLSEFETIANVLRLSATVRNDDPPVVRVLVSDIASSIRVRLKRNLTSLSGSIDSRLFSASELVVLVDVIPGALLVDVGLIPVEEELSIGVARARDVPVELSNDRMTLSATVAELGDVLPVVLGLHSALVDASICGDHNERDYEHKRNQLRTRHPLTHCRNHGRYFDHCCTSWVYDK